MKKFIKTFEAHSDTINGIHIFGDTQVGPVKIISAKTQDDGFLLTTSKGNFFISKDTYSNIKYTEDILQHPKPGYTYVLNVINQKVVDIAMSTVDLLVFHKSYDKMELLSIKRGHAPFLGYWANPGGNIDEGEFPIEAAIRELEEETSVVLKKHELEFVGMFDEPNRDPRNKLCVSYAFSCILSKKPDTLAQDDAADVTWLEIRNNGDELSITHNGEEVQLAFDHYDIVKKALL